MLKHITPWQVSLAAVTGALALAAVYTNVLIADRQQSLIESSGYNTVFDASQGATELVRLEAAIGRYAREPSSDRSKEAKLRYAIMESRVALLQQGMVNEPDRLAAGTRDALAALAAADRGRKASGRRSRAPGQCRENPRHAGRRSKSRP